LNGGASKASWTSHGVALMKHLFLHGEASGLNYVSMADNPNGTKSNSSDLLVIVVGFGCEESRIIGWTDGREEV